jgi:hypothetical protein
MRRGRAALGPGDLVVRAVEPDAAASAGVPDLADDLDRLAQRVDRLAGAEPASAHGLDRVPEPARADAELHPAAAEQVQAGHAAGQHGRLTQRQVQHVTRQGDALGPGRHVGHQRPGVEKRRLVRMILERDQVQPGRLGQLGELHHALGLLVARGEKDAERELMAVVSHRGNPASARTPGRMTASRTG